MSRFRTLQVTDPQFESEHLRHVTVKSSALRRRANLSVFVPPVAGQNGPLPVLILLHGVYGSHLDWWGRGGAHRIALEMIQKAEIRPMALAMPSDGLWGDGSGYVKHPGADYEKWIVEEVPAAVAEVAEEAGEDSLLGLSGLSMGGYGALRLGAKFPDRFAAVSGHSPITHLDQIDKFVEEDLADYAQPGPHEPDVLHWMKTHRDRLPPMRWDCGRDDLLIAFSRKLHADLDREKISHLYEEYDGGHTWKYWRVHLRDTLRFFEAHLPKQ